MRKSISLHSAGIVLILVAGNSFAQQTARTSTLSISPCASEMGRFFFAASRGETVSPNAGSETAPPSAAKGVPGCSVPTSTRSGAKSANQETASDVSKSDIGAVTDDESAQGPAPAQAPAGDAGELAKKLSNPVASLISVPFQSNFDFHMGTGSGWRYTLNMQPVVPVALNPEWNLISRTIVPFIHQGNVTAQGASQNGLGDIVQSFFFSPNKTEPLIWAVGPVVLIPTATNKSLGSRQLGLGPTVVALKQQGPWTYGALWNHIWRVAGGSGRPKANADFMQPFLVYGTKDGWTYSVNAESSYDWTGRDWGVPIHVAVSKVVKLGEQPISFQGGLRCWATSPAGGPEGCGIRIGITALFPKK